MACYIRKYGLLIWTDGWTDHLTVFCFVFGFNKNMNIKMSRRPFYSCFSQPHVKILYPILMKNQSFDEKKSL